MLGDAFPIKHRPFRNFSSSNHTHLQAGWVPDPWCNAGVIIDLIHPSELYLLLSGIWRFCKVSCIDIKSFYYIAFFIYEIQLFSSVVFLFSSRNYQFQRVTICL